MSSPPLGGSHGASLYEGERGGGGYSLLPSSSRVALDEGHYEESSLGGAHNDAHNELLIEYLLEYHNEGDLPSHLYPESPL